MYYHIRLDMVLPDGRTDMKSRISWDFRSLHQALEMIQRDYSPFAKDWCVEYLSTKPAGSALELESVLDETLPSTHQTVVLSFDEKSRLRDEYLCIQFVIFARDESERPVRYTFSEADEQKINSSDSIEHVFVDLFANPIKKEEIVKWTRICNAEQGIFSGIAVAIKGGGHWVVFAGLDGEERKINLAVRGIDNAFVNEIVPSTPDGKTLHGFIIRLKNGESLYLTEAAFVK